MAVTRFPVLDDREWWESARKRYTNNPEHYQAEEQFRNKASQLDNDTRCEICVSSVRIGIMVVSWVGEFLTQNLDRLVPSSTSQTIQPPLPYPEKPQNLDNTPSNQTQVPYHGYIRWKYYGNSLGNSLGNSSEIHRKFIGNMTGNTTEILRKSQSKQGRFDGNVVTKMWKDNTQQSCFPPAQSILYLNFNLNTTNNLSYNGYMTMVF